MSEINDAEEIPEGDSPIKLNLIEQYQHTEPILINKYKDGTCHNGYVCGVSNIDLNLITCKDKIVIPPIIQKYVLHWYHRYLLCPRTDIMEATIHQNLYWPGNRNSVQK